MTGVELLLLICPETVQKVSVSLAEDWKRAEIETVRLDECIVSGNNFIQDFFLELFTLFLLIADFYFFVICQNS